jgi:hypothetical protein
MGMRPRHGDWGGIAGAAPLGQEPQSSGTTSTASVLRIGTANFVAWTEREGMLVLGLTSGLYGIQSLAKNEQAPSYVVM